MTYISHYSWQIHISRYLLVCGNFGAKLEPNWIEIESLRTRIETLKCSILVRFKHIVLIWTISSPFTGTLPPNGASLRAFEGEIESLRTSIKGPIKPWKAQTKVFVLIISFRAFFLVRKARELAPVVLMKSLQSLLVRFWTLCRTGEYSTHSQYTQHSKHIALIRTIWSTSTGTQLLDSMIYQCVELFYRCATLSSPIPYIIHACARIHPIHAHKVLSCRMI